MLKLKDGTQINMSEAAHRFFMDIVKPAYASGDCILTVEGHTSQSSGRVATVALQLNYHYEEMVKEAICLIRDKTSEDWDTSEIPEETWQAAKEELLASLAESIVGNHSRDASSRSAQPFDTELPRVLVSLSRGSILLRGTVVHSEIEEPGKPKKPPVALLTRAKRWLEKGTYRESSRPGSIVSLSLKKGGFRKLICGEHVLTDDAFAEQHDAPPNIQTKSEVGAPPRPKVESVQEPALRVFQEQGFSKRIEIESEKSQECEVAFFYTHNEQRTILVSELRQLHPIDVSTSAFVELKQKKHVTGPVWIASVPQNEKVFVQQITGDSEDGKLRLGPDANNRIFIAVGNEKLKRLDEGESVFFISSEFAESDG